MGLLRKSSEGQAERLPRLHHVTVQIEPHQLQACLEFYREILGLKSVHSMIQQTAWFEQGVHLYWGDKNYDTPDTPLPHHFAVVVGDSYDYVVETCKKLNLFVGIGTNYWGSPRCYVRDPANNRVELMAYAP